MEIIKHKDAEEFLKDTQNLLQEKEAENNLILTTIFSLLKENKDKTSEYLLLSIVNNDETIFCCIITDQKTLLIFGKDELLEQSIALFSNYLLENNIKILMVKGLEKIAKAFIFSWQNLNKIDFKLSMNQKIYRLDSLSEIKYCNGYIRLATLDDLELISEWLYKFINEAVRKVDRQEAYKLAEQRIKNENIYLWIDNNIPVTMAAKARPTNNSITVNAVYTPLNYRAKGYSTSCVSKLSEILLKDYKFCTLLTDPENPIPNKIYQNIGYYYLNDYTEYKVIAS